MSKVTAEVFADHQHGPGIRVCVDDIRVSVYLHGETGIVSAPDGQHGTEVSGSWTTFREQARELYAGQPREPLASGQTSNTAPPSMTIEQAMDWLCATQQELQYLHEASADIPGQIAGMLRMERANNRELRAALQYAATALEYTRDMIVREDVLGSIAIAQMDGVIRKCRETLPAAESP